MKCGTKRRKKRRKKSHHLSWVHLRAPPRVGLINHMCNVHFPLHLPLAPKFP